jgi:hypothetical protein
MKGIVSMHKVMMKHVKEGESCEKHRQPAQNIQRSHG